MMETSEPVLSYRKVTTSSSRNFGFVFAVAFAVIAFAPLILHGERLRLWALLIAVLFGATALFAPNRLDALKKLWLRFGEAIHRVVNPLIMGLMYYGAVVPTGVCLRLAGKDLLRLRRVPEAMTYWIPRETPKKGSMSKQF